MKTIYLTLAAAGFIAPNIFVTLVSIETGNILRCLDPLATIDGMFANQISTAFMVDLFFVVGVFFLWSHTEAKKLKMAHPWKLWILTMLFGIAVAFPLFLFQRENHTSKVS